MKTNDIINKITPEISRILGEEYKYFKSYATFRKKMQFGFCYLNLDLVTHNNRTYYLALRPMVRHDIVHVMIGKISGENQNIDHYTRTISHYTSNVGPTSGKCKYALQGSWGLHNENEFPEVIINLKEFIGAWVIPFIDRHCTLSNIRETFLFSPDNAVDFKPWRMVTAINCIALDLDRQLQDYRLLKNMYSRYLDEYQIDMDNIHKSAIEYLENNKSNG
jgi:hypothetical protein